MKKATASLKSLPNIGPTIARKLEEAGIKDRTDFLRRTPTRSSTS